jgi:hypothetical protein
MSLMPIIVIAGALLAPTQSGQPPPISISVVAVHATTQGGAKQFDAGLESVRAALADLEFDRYRKLSAAVVSAPFNQESSVDLGSGYSLFVTPLARERNGQTRINVKVQMASKEAGGRPVNAVATTIMIAPGKQFKLRGLKMDPGELVVVMSLEK